MSWTAHYFGRRLNSEGVGRACASKEDALRLACDLIHRKCIVRFITGPNEAGRQIAILGSAGSNRFLPTVACSRAE